MQGRVSQISRQWLHLAHLVQGGYTEEGTHGKGWEVAAKGLTMFYFFT